MNTFVGLLVCLSVRLPLEKMSKIGENPGFGLHLKQKL